MAKRKKYPKLPNGYGSIKYLGKGRRNPYAVHPPTKEFNELNDAPLTPKALCYVDDWFKGFAVLTAYHAGTYEKGMEKTLVISEDDYALGELSKSIMANYCRMAGITRKNDEGPTFAEVYEKFYAWKYERPRKNPLSDSSRRSTQAAFKNCSVLHDRYFATLTRTDLQDVLDKCELKHASLELIASLFKQMYQFAIMEGLIKDSQDVARYVAIEKPDDDESGVPFTENDLKILWKHKDDPTVEFILIMCYSGYRISAYKTLKVDLKDGYFQGGVKTVAGKDRIVPIHSAILPLVKNRLNRDGDLLKVGLATFRTIMYSTLENLEIEPHTPHDCRHTFSALCEKYKVNENDRKRMLGHSFGKDITNGVYGHRELADLRAEIEKIKICD